MPAASAAAPTHLSPPLSPDPVGPWPFHDDEDEDSDEMEEEFDEDADSDNEDGFENGGDDFEEDESGTIIITDFKTSGRAYSIDEVDSNMQMTVYQLAMKSNGFGGREILLKLDCLIKTKKPRYEQYYTTRSYIDELRLIRKIEKVWEGINNEVFVPNDTSWRHKNCPYRSACDSWFLQGGE